MSWSVHHGVCLGQGETSSRPGRQMDQQDRVREIFEPFQKARTEAEEQAGTGVWAGDDIEPTEGEQAEVDAILGRAPRSGAAA